MSLFFFFFDVSKWWQTTELCFSSDNHLRLTLRANPGWGEVNVGLCLMPNECMGIPPSWCNRAFHELYFFFFFQIKIQNLFNLLVRAFLDFHSIFLLEKNRNCQYLNREKNKVYFQGPQNFHFHLNFHCLCYQVDNIMMRLERWDIKSWKNDNHTYNYGFE